MWVVISGILWFLPEITGRVTYATADQVTMMFMKQWKLFSLPVWASKLSAFFITAALSLIVMRQSERLQIVPVRSAMPFIMYMVTAAAIESVQRCDERLIAATIILFAIGQIVEMYSFDKQVIAGFNVMLLTGLAALFEPEYVWLEFLFVVGTIIFRVVTKRVFYSLLLGAATVVFTLWGTFWLTDSLPVLTAYAARIIDIAPWQLPEIALYDIAFGAAIIMLFAVSVAGYFGMSGSYNLNVRLNETFVAWSFIITLLWLALFNHHTEFLLAIPLMFWSLSTALYFSTNYKQTANAMWLVWLVGTVTYRICVTIVL